MPRYAISKTPLDFMLCVIENGAHSFLFPTRKQADRFRRACYQVRARARRKQAKTGAPVTVTTYDGIEFEMITAPEGVEIWGIFTGVEAPEQRPVSREEAERIDEIRKERTRNAVKGRSLLTNEVC